MTGQRTFSLDNKSGSLADVLERVLDKGVVIVGDIAVNVVDVELLTLRLRLFVASAQTAREMGMDWWTNDPFFAPHAAANKQVDQTSTRELEQQNEELRERIGELEKALNERTPAALETPRSGSPRTGKGRKR
jgi:hypothetical protein